MNQATTPSGNMEQAQFEKALAEIREINANTNKLFADTAKAKRETFFYPLVAGALGATAIITFTKLFL